MPWENERENIEASRQGHAAGNQGDIRRIESRRGHPHLFLVFVLGCFALAQHGQQQCREIQVFFLFLFFWVGIRVREIEI